MLNMRHWGQPDWMRFIPPFSSLRSRLERTWPPLVSNRNFSFAQKLLRDPGIEQILFIDQPPIDVRRAIKTLLTTGIDRLRPMPEGSASMYSSVLPAISRSGWVHRIRHHLKQLGMNERLLVWSYHPFFPELLECIPATIKVFDAVDDWTTLPQYQHRKEELEADYEWINRKADVIFTVSPSLQQHRFGSHPHCTWIPNGVDLELFQHPKSCSLPGLDGLKPPLIGYVGVIENRLDVELLTSVIARHPDKTFVFVGLVWPSARIERLQSFPNVKLLGPLPFDAIPGVLQRFDVAMIPHRMNALTATMNPLKIYEYFAAGLPIVTTAIAGIEPFADQVFVAKNANEFSDHINAALAEDTPEQHRERQQFIQAHTWERRLQAMMAVIDAVAAEKQRTPNPTNNMAGEGGKTP